MYILFQKLSALISFSALVESQTRNSPETASLAAERKRLPIGF